MIGKTGGPLRAMSGFVKIRDYIAGVYALFICLAVLLLGIMVNIFAEKLFSEYIKVNIQNENDEIVRSFTEQYNPFTRDFNMDSINAIGMHYLHQGYLISLDDAEGDNIWNVHDTNMQQCAIIINEISTRMENEYRVSGSFRNNEYIITSGHSPVGKVNIETYGPFFYQENETAFLRTLNKFLVIVGIVFVLLSIVVSVCSACPITRPLLQAKEAARRISGGDFSTRMPETYATRELHELSRSVNELAQALENGEKWQKRLSSDIAHELRTPLTTLQGNIEAMLDGIWEPSNERLASCHEEILRLYKLVEDLSLLSILERDNLTLHKTDFDLNKLIDKAIGQFLPLAREKGIEIVTGTGTSAPATKPSEGSPPLPPPPAPPALTLYADYDRLTQVLINLLSNAVKYTDSGTIRVGARQITGNSNTADKRSAGKKPGNCEITVADTGIGIPPEALPHVFERFYRTDISRNRSTGGAGIGLSIAAAIVEAHGGRISVESPNPASPGNRGGDSNGNAGGGKDNNGNDNDAGGGKDNAGSGKGSVFRIVL
ncbi:MAG: HAMP domain-containing protein, partial [Treponema sp.]|nr:HAMP domain-containing protein [Treponema sp.]